MGNNEQNNQIVFYQSDDGKPRIDVKFQGETAWLTQTQLVNLFGSSKANVSEHIKHIFEERELERDSVVRNFRTTATDGKTYEVEHYNLDMIISLGYRVKSRIEKLIADLCPEGVELKELIEIGEVTIGEFVHKNTKVV